MSSKETALSAVVTFIQSLLHRMLGPVVFQPVSLDQEATKTES